MRPIRSPEGVLLRLGGQRGAALATAASRGHLCGYFVEPTVLTKSSPADVLR